MTIDKEGGNLQRSKMVRGVTLCCNAVTFVEKFSV